MQKNCGIRCDVESCTHNQKGEQCKLKCVKITCGCGDQCTCCGDYEER